MKKFVKAMSVFAALAMLGAGFISCSGDDDDDTPATKYKVTYVSEKGTAPAAVEVEEGKTTKLPAIADVTESDKTYTLKMWLDGTTEAGAPNADYKVTKDVTLTANWEEKSDVPGGSLADPVTYKAGDITAEEQGAWTLTSKAAIKDAGTYSIWGGKGSITTAAEKMGIKMDSNKENKVISITSATNMSGKNVNVKVPAAGINLSELNTEGGSLANYVKVATPAAGNTKVTMKITTTAASGKQWDLSKDNGGSFWILATDATGKILAVKDIGDLTDTSVSYTEADIEVGTFVAGTDVCFGFARAYGSGGLQFNEITLTPVAE